MYSCAIHIVVIRFGRLFFFSLCNGRIRTLCTHTHDVLSINYELNHFFSHSNPSVNGYRMQNNVQDEMTKNSLFVSLIK